MSKIVRDCQRLSEIGKGCRRLLKIVRGGQRLIISYKSADLELKGVQNEIFTLSIGVQEGYLGTVSKKKLMEFSFKLAGWVLDDPIFH